MKVKKYKYLVCVGWHNGGTQISKISSDIPLDLDKIHRMLVIEDDFDENYDNLIFEEDNDVCTYRVPADYDFRLPDERGEEESDED